MIVPTGHLGISLEDLFNFKTDKLETQVNLVGESVRFLAYANLGLLAALTLGLIWTARR